MAESITNYETATETASFNVGSVSKTRGDYVTKNIQLTSASEQLDGTGASIVSSIAPNQTEVNQLPIVYTGNVDANDGLKLLEVTGPTVDSIVVKFANGNVVPGSYNKATQVWSNEVQADSSSDPTRGENGITVELDGVDINFNGTLHLLGKYL